MNLLFPGRHHLLTNFQHEYVKNLIQNGLKGIKNIYGKNIDENYKISSIIFAVTSANHFNTRRNPLSFYLRAMMLQSFSDDFNIPVYIYGIDDVGHLENFAEYTVKYIEHQSDYKIKLTPENTFVLCSTPVLNMYKDMGFEILPAELKDYNKWKYNEDLPWKFVERVASKHDSWNSDEIIKTKVNQATIELYTTYNLGKKISVLFNDDMIGDDGDITETRDYNTYVRQMDEIANLKYVETKPYIVSGRIGDIGCAVGSWIKLASENVNFRESDFYGIEVARKLYDICMQRKNNGEFLNPFVFFSRKNAVTGLCFEKGTMNTIHTSSLTHEIESYGGRQDLINFIRNRHKELAPGGVWINRDVVGPKENKNTVYLKLTKDDGDNTNWDFESNDTVETEKKLSSLSTFSRFLKFAKDFRKNYNYKVEYEIIDINGVDFIKTSLFNACEYLSKKDYTDNWLSEMHESFCFFSIEDWKNIMMKNGFEILASSNAYANPWIINNRYKNKAWFYTKIGENFKLMNYPVTNMLLIARKII